MLRLLALSLAFAVTPEAQSFVVESSAPADYASGVATDATVAFTFSDPLGDISQGFGTAPTLVILPTEGATITATDQSVDGRTVTYSVTLQDDQRYVFLVLGARSASGETLARPYALNLSTGSGGFFTVQGDVTDPAAQRLDGTLVALVTGDVSTGEVDIAAVRVIDSESSTASYSVGPVGLGLYTAAAVRLPFPLDVAPTPEALDRLAFGFYDPDGDGTPNPIFGTSGIDIEIAPPDPTTADETYSDALATASGAISTPVLVAIPPTPVNEVGQSVAWRYTFQSEVDFSKVDVVQVGPLGFPIENVDDVVAMPLPTPFVDSEMAIGVADNNGGAAFRAANSPRIVVVTMSADALASAPGEPAWRVLYTARDTPDGPVVDSLEEFVPFSFADAIAPEANSDLSLRHHGAHPRGSGLAVSVSLAAPSDARIDVLDARGRRVAVLHDGPLAAGDASFHLDHALPAGVYAVRLVTPEARRVLRAVVTR